MAKILVIDDSLFQRKKILSIIKGLGHDVSEAENGEQGIEVAQNYQPDCIFCDLLMPVLDGFGFLEKFNSMDLKTPVIMLTADIQDSAKNNCMELGATLFLNKPPKQTDIQGALDKVLSK